MKDSLRRNSAFLLRPGPGVLLVPSVRDVEADRRKDAAQAPTSRVDLADLWTSVPSLVKEIILVLQSKKEEDENSGAQHRESTQ